MDRFPHFRTNSAIAETLVRNPVSTVCRSSALVPSPPLGGEVVRKVRCGAFCRGLRLAPGSAPFRTNSQDRRMTKTPNLNRPAYAQRPSMRPHTLSRKIQTSQSRVMKVKPAKITLPPMPEELKR